MIKSLDTKIADIRANPSGSKAFIIADAKDADKLLPLEQGHGQKSAGARILGQRGVRLLRPQIGLLHNPLFRHNAPQGGGIGDIYNGRPFMKLQKLRRSVV